MRSDALRTLALLAATCVAWQANAQPAGATPPFEAGTHYTVITPPQPTSTDDGKIEVTEIFMFACPGCFAFEPHLQRWLEKKADYINFVRIPAAWNPTAEIHARAYYTAEALGKLGEIDEPFFTAFHTQRNYLETEAKLADFFEQHGVDKATFARTFNSFAVTAKLKRAEELIGRYGVESTPSVVVNGKYLATGRMAGTYEAWFAIVDELAAREHAAAGSAAR